MLDGGGEEPRVEVVMGVPVAGNVTLRRAPRHSTPPLRLHHPIAANQLYMTQLQLVSDSVHSNNVLKYSILLVFWISFLLSSSTAGNIISPLTPYFPPSISEAVTQLNATKTEIFSQILRKKLGFKIDNFSIDLSHLPSRLSKGRKDMGMHKRFFKCRC